MEAVVGDYLAARPHPELNWRGWTLLAGVLLVEFAVYFPILQNDFALADDYGALFHAKTHGTSARGIFYPLNGHIIPVFRLLFALEFRLFGMNPVGYYAINLVLHLTATALTAIFISEIARSWYVGVAAALLFGVSAAHPQPVLCILASNSSLAGVAFLGSAYCFKRHLDTQKTILLVAALAFHASAFLSLSYGAETPVMFFLLCLALDRERPMKARLLRALRYLLIFGLNAGFLLGFRAWMLSRYPEAGEVHVADLRTLILGLHPRLLGFLAGGIYEGLLKSYTGAFFLGSGSSFVPAPEKAGAAEADWIPVFQACLVFVVLVGLVLITDWRSPRSRARAPLALCMFAWCIILYSLPIITRGISGFEFPGGGVFKLDYKSLAIGSDRYRYVPGIPAAGAFVLAFAEPRPIRNWISPRWQRIALICLFGIILIPNIVQVRKKASFLHTVSIAFREARTTLATEVTAQLKKSPDGFAILNVPFARSSFIGWPLRPNLLLGLDLPADIEKLIAYIDLKALDSPGAPARVFGVRPRGNIYVLDRRSR